MSLCCVELETTISTGRARDYPSYHTGQVQRHKQRPGAPARRSGPLLRLPRKRYRLGGSTVSVSSKLHTEPASLPLRIWGLLS